MSAPTRIGRFVIDGKLGAGGQAVVYSAFDPELDRRVALKVLHGRQSEEGLARFRREAAVAAKLEHPGICPVYEAGSTDGLTWIAMRYIKGGTLSQRYFTGSAFNEDTMTIAAGDGPTVAEMSARSETPGGDRIRDLVVCFEKIARALHAAHEAGIVHRDIKPGNIFIDEHDEPVVLDFGLARDDDSHGPELTRTDALMGTPPYMSPEQVAGQARQLGPSTDVWSLGVCLYEGITGRRPFEAATREAMFMKIVQVDPVDPRRLNAAVGRDLAAVTLAALEKNLQRRYASAAAFADDLRNVLQRRPVSVKPPSLPARIIRWTKRRPAQATIAALVVVLLGVGGFVAAHWDDFMLGAETRLAAEIDDHLDGGYLHLGEGDAQIALRSFRNAIELAPTNVEAMTGLVMVHQRLDDHEAALAVLDGFAGDRSPEYLRVKADALRKSGDREGAKAIEDTIPPPATALDRFILGMQAMRAGEGGDPRGFPYAVHHLRLALVLNETQRPLHWYQYGHAVGHDERAKGEAAMVRDVLTQRWPKSAQAWFWAGFASREADPQRAIDCYREARRLGIDGVPVNFNIAMLMVDLSTRTRDRARRDELLEGAVVDLGKALDTDELSRSTILTQMGQCLKDLQRYQDAIDVLQRAVSADETNADALMAAGNTFKEWGLAEGGDDLLRNAVASLEKAAKIDPESALIAYNLGVARAAYADEEGAIEAYETAVRLDPKHDGAWSNLGSTLAELDRHEESIARLREGARNCPNDFGIHYNLGTALVARGAADEGVTFLEKAVRIDGSIPQGWINLGQGLRKVGRLRESADAYRRGHELAQKRPDWNLPSDRWLKDAEARVEQLERLEALADGEPLRPNDAPMQWLSFALHAREYELGVRFAQRVVGESADFSLYALAARAAARAGERALALKWLSAALDSVPAGERGTRRVESWIEDPAFAPLQSLVGLDGEERAAWAALWVRLVQRADQ